MSTTRRSPIDPAKNYSRGTIAVGLDGNRWMVSIDINKHKRWIPCSAKTVDCDTNPQRGRRVPRKVRSKKRSRRNCNYPYPAELYTQTGRLRKDRRSMREIRRIRKNYDCITRSANQIESPIFTPDMPIVKKIDYELDFPFDKIDTVKGKFAQQYEPTHDEIEISIGMFNNASTYKKVLMLNILFISGKLKATPYHLGPLEIDSQKLVDQLLALHEYGILTHNGQAGWFGCEIRDAMDTDDPYMAATMQRPFIMFCVPKGELADYLHVNLVKIPQLAVKIIDGTGPKTIYSNPSSGKYVLTRSKVLTENATMEKLRSAPWKDYTAQPFGKAIMGEILLEIPYMDDNRDKFLYFFVAHKEWCSKISLEKIIINLAKTSGSPKIITL